jgi:hypothetical protein
MSDSKAIQIVYGLGAVNYRRFFNGPNLVPLSLFLMENLELTLDH